jgi:DNA polymerase-3 subunit gamma/tau
MSVFHLKYRPKKLSELDLPEVSKTLSMIMESKERPGSFLLAGPKGAGKTSAARILAKSINCEKPNGVEACGKCANCLEIETGASIDIIEIDGASNRGIDDMRMIKERAYLLPSRLKIKVFVIDEVHMLTKEAFNALLKILEEPPKHTLFILCTTDPEKIPETVLSRLVRVDFRKGSREDLRRSLERVIKAEKLLVEKEAVELLIDKSDGSFRNLHKTINEVWMENGKKIGLKQVEEYFAGRVGNYNGKQLEEDLCFGKTKKILETLEKIATKGVDFAALRIDYLLYFQKRL